ncbi:MAG TPA: Hsp70 family protein [Pirellulaceae bacterium]|nr:Hsp70 family protein [Pirellulaceae bacterium]
MARELIARQKLTEFQLKRVLEGDPKSLVLGNNVILDKVGEGGMGEVFKAMHRRMRRLVCVKVLRPTLINSESAIKRFQREVQAAAHLSHPNIVTAFDADEAHGIHFLVMEFVDGVDLGTHVNRKGPLAISDVINYIAQAARGLEYAHSRGIIHRDIKPGNLLLDRTGTIKILDMGLARFDALGEKAEDGEHLTRDNQIVGTVEYMSPEQADDSGRVDRRSDIYSLGCTMYRLLIGRPPYTADTPLNVLMAHRVRDIPSLRTSRPEVPPALELIYRKMMAKNPADRFQSMQELLHSLEPLLDQASFDVGQATRRPRTTPPEYAPTRTVTLDGVVPETTSGIQRGEESTDSDHGGVVPPPQQAAPPAAVNWPRPSSSALRRHPAVGIDLGTTFSVVAHLDEQGRPQAVVNTEGDVTTPSVVLFDGDEVVVGKEAVKAMSVEADHVAECAKRELGQRVFSKAMQGRKYPPEVIQAYVLNKLRTDAARFIGPFRQVVITVPAYFDETRRKATQDAGYMAGFDVLDIINEPTAAALAFGFQRGYFNPGAKSTDVERILVYDLGGGTFDVTIMEIRGNEFITLATDGDARLGGRDWDQRLVDFVADQFRGQHGIDPRDDANIMGRLWRDCEEAKRTLTARMKTHVVCDYKGLSLRVEVTRQLLQELTFDLLERTAFTTRQTLQATGLEWKDVKRVLLVGGATRMPSVVEMLRNLTGKEPDSSVAPDEAVALGAALQAGLILARLRGESPRFKVRNVNSHSLGIVGTDAKTGRKQNAIIIPRNTPLPCVVKKTFTTKKPNQTSLLIQMVEGESTSPQECASLGKCTLTGLPPNLPAQTPLDVRFQYSENGRITVTVKVPGRDELVEQVIERENSMKQDELDRWRLSISGLPPAPPFSLQQLLRPREAAPPA